MIRWTDPAAPVDYLNKAHELIQEFVTSGTVATIQERPLLESLSDSVRYTQFQQRTAICARAKELSSMSIAERRKKNRYRRANLIITFYVESNTLVFRVSLRKNGLKRGLPIGPQDKSFGENYTFFSQEMARQLWELVEPINNQSLPNLLLILRVSKARSFSMP